MGLDEWYNRGYTQGMKTAISIPDDLFEAAERVADRLGLSRSELYQRAVAAYLQRHSEALITQELNRVYGGAAVAAVDLVLDQLQRASLVRESW